MGTLRTIETWPYGGHVDAPWDEDVDVDAFVKTARRVCDRYSAEVRDLSIPARLSLVRFFVHKSAVAEVSVEVNVDPTTDFEGGGILVPAGTADLTPQQRARLVLDSLHAGVLRLAEARGWDAHLLEAAEQQTLAAGLEFTWAGPWKAARHRRTRARPVFRLDDDGWGRVAIEVEDRATARCLGFTGALATWSSEEGFRRAARTLRWESPDAVSIEPRIEPFGDSDGPTIVDVGPDALSDRSPFEQQAGAVPDNPPYDVRAVGVGAQAPEQLPQIQFVGYARPKSLSRDYLRNVTPLLMRLEERPEWLAWWTASGVTFLELVADFDGPARAGSLLRVTGQRALAKLNRPAQTMKEGEAGVRQAHADVLALVLKIQDRFGLAEPPALPDADRLVDSHRRLTGSGDDR